MENNNKIRDLYEIYLELGHDVFEERIKKPTELCLQNSCSNVISMNSLNTIISNAMEKSKLGEGSFYDLFGSPVLEEKICFDDTLSPVYDDYNDSGILEPPTIVDKVYCHYDVPPIYDVYNDKLAIFSPSTIAIYDDYNDGCDSFTPTITNETVYAYVESNDTSMHVAHDKNVLCDSYIVNFIHDATESYYERGKYGFMYLNNIKFPLFMLKILELHLFCFPMIAALCFHDLFSYKVPLHRKWVRLKRV